MEKKYEIKKTIYLWKDVSWLKTYVTMEITYRNWYDEFTCSWVIWPKRNGDCDWSCWQITIDRNTFCPVNIDLFNKVLDYRDKYHLNWMSAWTTIQNHLLIQKFWEIPEYKIAREYLDRPEIRKIQKEQEPEKDYKEYHYWNNRITIGVPIEEIFKFIESCDKATDYPRRD